MFLRGYAVYFDQEKTGFGTAAKDHCYAKEDKLGVGTVEWAPVIHTKPKHKPNVLLITIIIVLSVVIITCVAVIIYLKQERFVGISSRKKNDAMVRKFGYNKMDDLPTNV